MKDDPKQTDTIEVSYEDELGWIASLLRDGKYIFAEGNSKEEAVENVKKAAQELAPEGAR